MTYLADANLLIARVSSSHEFHESAKQWLASVRRFSTCPITEGALVRFLKWQQPRAPQLAQEVLDQIAAFPGHEFWPDDLTYRHIDLHRIGGHKQVTDAYLVALARSKHGKLATFDQALAEMHEDVELVRA